MIKIISGGATDRDSNRERQIHSRRLESFLVGVRHRPMDDPVISFRPSDLKDVTALHEYVLVIWATIVNYDVARVLVDSRSSINILFKEACDWMQVNPTLVHLIICLCRA